MINVLKQYNLKGTIAIITGGAGLLGEMHAETILEANGKVVILDIHEKRLKDRVVKLRQKYGENVWGYQLDITNESQIKDVCRQIQDEVGHIGILINNVTNNPDVNKGAEVLTRLENFPLERWNNDMAVGVTGAFLISRELGTKMAERGKGVILNIGSDLAVIAPDQRIYRNPNLPESQQPVKPVTYSVAKHAIIGLTKYLSTYWADKGVRVNAISPGGIYGEGLSKDFVERLSNLIPLGRMAKLDDYKGAILFLISDASVYMTGTNLIVDGGRSAW